MDTTRSGTTEETGVSIDLDGILGRISNPDNWTDAFLEEVDKCYSEHFNRIRNTLTKAGKWKDFDTAYCEWKRPGQVQALSAAQEEKQEEQKRKPVCDRGKARTVKEFKPIQPVTAAELDRLDIPPIEWIVEKILPIGLSMIGAPSKYYKSYMALGLCVAICNGSKFLGFDCNKHACLYLDLESTKRRPKNRLDQIVGAFKEKPSNLYIITGTDEPGRIGDGFEAQIEYQLKEHPDIKLIIVDVFQMIRQPAKKNQSGYDRDYDDFKALKRIADNYNIGLMLIHHTRKMKDPNDVFNEFSGSVGVLGALDCAWLITKEDRYSEEGTLHITGRDMESQKLKIKFNKRTFQWEYLGTEDDINAQRLRVEYDQSPIIETIKKLVKQGNGHWEGSASDIKNASKYLSWEIYDTPQKIGSLIRKYEALLYFDGIEFVDKGHVGKTRTRTLSFNVLNDRNVQSVQDVHNVQQMELKIQEEQCRTCEQ